MPIFELNNIVSKFKFKCLLIQCAAARVACPHRSISISGVNHLILNFEFSFIKKAVSETLFFFAIFNNISSLNHFFNGTTQAGLPNNFLDVNAFILKFLRII